MARTSNKAQEIMDYVNRFVHKNIKFLQWGSLLTLRGKRGKLRTNEISTL